MVGPSTFPSTNVLKPGRIVGDDDNTDDAFLLLLRFPPLIQLVLRASRQPLRAPETRGSVALGIQGSDRIVGQLSIKFNLLLAVSRESIMHRVTNERFLDSSERYHQ